MEQLELNQDPLGHRSPSLCRCVLGALEQNGRPRMGWLRWETDWRRSEDGMDDRFCVV